MDRLRVTVLGTGTSHGIPMIGCHCAVCSSTDPHDRRTRTSAFVQVTGTANEKTANGQVADGTASSKQPATNASSSSPTDRFILIDTPPELRIQCLANQVEHVDAILYTHQHADHIVGLDDLRRFNALEQTNLPCYANGPTLQTLLRMFPYAFTHDPTYPSAKPELTQIEVAGPFDVKGIPVTPVPLLHGRLPILGYRIGRFAYCTDCNEIPPASMELLQDLDVLILDALRVRPHPTHFTIDQAVAAARQINARQTFFTHIAHELPHAATNANLPPRMALAYDGQIIDVAN